MRSLAFTLCLFALPGCNVVRWQQAALAGDLRDRGLESADARVGEATVHHWRRRGEGTPVVFLHGFGTPAIWQWQAQIDAFPERPLVLPDLLHFGGSTRRGAFSLDAQVEAIDGLLESLGIEEADVVGISYGGLVAYELAASRPERVRRLVLIDSPGRAYRRSDLARLRSRFGVRRAEELFIPTTDAETRRLIGLAYADPPWIPDLLLQQVREVFYRDPVSLRALVRSLTGDLERLRARPDPVAPTLLVWGREDAVFPLPIGRRLAARLGDRARLVVIDHAAHAPNVEHPERVNALLREFLR